MQTFLPLFHRSRVLVRLTEVRVPLMVNRAVRPLINLLRGSERHLWAHISQNLEHIESKQQLHLPSRKNEQKWCTRLQLFGETSVKLTSRRVWKQIHSMWLLYKVHQLHFYAVRHGVLVCPRRRRTIVLSSRGFNIEKPSKDAHGFPVVLAVSVEPRRKVSRWEWRSWSQMELIWDQLLSDWLLFVRREGSWFGLSPSGWLLDPPYDSANRSSWRPKSVVGEEEEGGNSTRTRKRQTQGETPLNGGGRRIPYI